MHEEDVRSIQPLLRTSPPGEHTRPIVNEANYGSTRTTTPSSETGTEATPSTGETRVT